MLQRAGTLLTPAPRTEPDVWAAENRIYPESAGVPGPRDPGLTGYMIPFARKVHAGKHRRVVAVTAAQSGKTDNILDLIGARLDQRPAPILYVGPSGEFVRDQFEPRIMELLDQAETLRNKVVRGRRMKKTLKYVAGVRLRLASAGSSTALKSDPFSLGIVDEYDEMVANIKGQGDPLGLVEARGDTYADFVTAIVSTPGQGLVETEVDPVSGLEFWRKADPEQIDSPIWKLWQSGTRHHFAWPCPHCGEFFVPMSKHLGGIEGKTPSQASRDAHLVCPNNGCNIENHSKPEMIAGGVQIAPGQTIDEAFAEAAGETDGPDNDTWSCWTSGLCSPFVTWGERAKRLLTARASGSPDEEQTVMNASFGEVFNPAQRSDAPKWEELLKNNRLPYMRGEVPAEAYRIGMTVDVQKFSLYYIIRAFGARGTSWLLDYGQLYGPTADDDVWSALADRMTQPIGGYPIEKVFIDAGFRPDKPEAGSEHKVYEFCRRWSWLCTPCRGLATGRVPYSISKIEVKPDGKKALYSIGVAMLNTDFFKSLVVSRMQIPPGTPGAFYLHSGEVDEYEDYARQVTSEVRTIENGRPKWVQRQKDNHFFDCESMMAALGYTWNVQRIPEPRNPQSNEAPEGVERPVETPPAGDNSGDGSAREEAATPPPDTTPAPKSSPAKGGGGVQARKNRFANMGRRLNR